jgi:hypothetical protein
MTVHITLAGVLEVIGAAAVTAFLIFLVYGLYVIWRWGK